MTVPIARMPGDDFPSTRCSWMFDLLCLGAEGEGVLRARVMDRYYTALLAYAQGVARLQHVEPQELVNSFLASRLGRPDYFARWQASGLPFRRWLLNGLHFCARELRTAGRENDRRASGIGVLACDEGEPIESRDTQADRAFERAFAQGVVARAVGSVQASLATRGRTQDWPLFWRHHIDGVPYRALSESSCLSPRALNGIVRGVTAELRSALRMELLAEGLGELEIDTELSNIEEALRP